MKARIPIILMICAALIISIISSHAETADSEALGRQAESEGRLRAALTHYIDALQSVTEASDRDLELRKAIIKLSLKLQPPPAIPDAVFEYEGRGEAAMQAQAYNDAVKEYKKVLLLAPWFAGYYYNLATALEGEHKPSEAIRNYNLYLLAAPNAEDARQVKKSIGRLKYMAENRVANSDHQKSYNRETSKSRLEELAGIWRAYYKNGYPGSPYKYNPVTHYRAEAIGSELLLTCVYDRPFLKYRRGHERPEYRIRQEGSGFAGTTANYDEALATQEIRVEVSRNNKILTITYWDRITGKLTASYHNCLDSNIRSCSPPN